jgi:hypothetical protein
MHASLPAATHFFLEKIINNRLDRNAMLFSFCETKLLKSFQTVTNIALLTCASGLTWRRPEGSDLRCLIPPFLIFLPKVSGSGFQVHRL